MTYRELLAAAQRNPQEADFQSLRLAYTRSAEYAPYVHDVERVETLRVALHAGDLAAALEAALGLLEHNYLDIEAHMAADYVYTRLDDTRESAYHRAFARGLIAAILSSGDGRGTGGAFTVISVPEEHTVLRVLGLRLVRQTLIQVDGRSFDVIDTHHPASGEPMQVYFNVDLPRGWLAQHLAGDQTPHDDPAPDSETPAS